MSKSLANQELAFCKMAFNNSGNFYWKNKSVRCVHTLQNIYFFNELTGGELQITN